MQSGYDRKSTNELYLMCTDKNIRGSILSDETGKFSVNFNTLFDINYMIYCVTCTHTDLRIKRYIISYAFISTLNDDELECHLTYIEYNQLLKNIFVSRQFL